MSNPINDVVIVGRDAPLWLAASVMQSALAPAGVRITAVELPSQLQASDVYATLPALEALHARLRIDEARMLGAAAGAFSLGQNFVDATGATPPFFHAYGAYGAPIEGKAFLPYWLKARRFGLGVAFEDFSLTAAAAKHGRMLIPDPSTEAYGRTDYAYHLPALAYASLLKQVAAARGVAMHTAHAVDVALNSESGAIEALRLDGDRSIAGQFFVDASGQGATLLAALDVAWENWRTHFIADRVLTASGPRFDAPPAYAEVRAHSQGWLAMHPSQARTHIVSVYASEECTDDAAAQMATRTSGFGLSDAAIRAREPGLRLATWARNCVAVGDAACVLDPIHGVDLHAVHLGVVHLLSLFPVNDAFAAEREEYNRIARLSYERLRDFQSAHYRVNRYAGAGFWARARAAAVSPELAHKLETFKARGELPLYENETFTQESWQALLLGHGVTPDTYDPIIDRTPPEQMKHEFRRILSFIKTKVEEQTTHAAYLHSVCPATAEQGSR